jgi:hypothetical protein
VRPAASAWARSTVMPQTGSIVVGAIRSVIECLLHWVGWVPIEYYRGV